MCKESHLIAVWQKLKPKKNGDITNNVMSPISILIYGK